MAVAGGALAVLPAFAVSDTAAGWVNLASSIHTYDTPLQGGYNPEIEQIAVDGSLPQAPVPVPLPSDQLPNGPLGVPETVFRAYRAAADKLTEQQPGCHIDWALIASIGRIESNHARGGYVAANGDTLEPILGPVLNGKGPFAAIPDTDQGKFDGDKVWDRAVGPMQFIPSTWWGYASDGNDDGQSNPNNIFDAALATGKYLCSGGLNLSDPGQLRAAIYRYNHSDYYVNTVIMWAEAYRRGVTPTPDSKVPVGAPDAGATPGPGEVPTPTVPTTTPSPTATATIPPGTGTNSSSKPSSPTTSSSGSPTTKPTTPTPPTTTPTCSTSTTTPTTTTPTTTLPPCQGSISPTPPSGGSGTTTTK
ncbi:Transglycosylase SLT domain-containing protein [Amycolatopsis xylanica]|uniref:Transglycosylase SLT domain-containing protein n=1 Tax=Amycolatopsis xylanica TaxID=589385 RepID=A0A1H3ENI0_9PSEU|nr:Transglycosylase SLT domain-containing protein [Amycolatopsis xylanica]